jgi:hypothetical protein
MQKGPRICAAFFVRNRPKAFFMFRDGTAMAVSGFVFRGTEKLARQFGRLTA